MGANDSDFQFDFEAYLRAERDKVIAARAVTEILQLSQAISLVEAAADGLVRAFRRLDAIPRTDAFWRGGNPLPTVSKLQRLCRERSVSSASGLDFAWALVALAAAQ